MKASSAISIDRNIQFDTSSIALRVIVQNGIRSLDRLVDKSINIAFNAKELTEE